MKETLAVGGGKGESRDRPLVCFRMFFSVFYLCFALLVYNMSLAYILLCTVASRIWRQRRWLGDDEMDPSLSGSHFQERFGLTCV